MFYNQPLAHRFGTELASDIENGKWTRIEMAVAWVRRSGTQYLESSFKKFLSIGGFAQVIVGVDIENTSAEGLKDFLSLQTDGNIEIYIHHNEADTTFHPKVYLLWNDADARLIVGSNNLTRAGLFVNTEAGLQLDAPLTDPLIRDARIALAAWRDPATGFAKRLDATLLDDLIRLGYVFPEQELRKRRSASDAQSKAKRSAPTQTLFKAQRYTAPSVHRANVPAAQVPGTVLLMRVRRASETARRTQIQIPFRVVRTNFFAGITVLVSDHDNRKHPLVLASARGGPNTVKTEIPEIESMVDPVLRLERTANSIMYRAFDADSVLGAPIKQALLNGFRMLPPTSYSSIADLTKATLWRFI
ncbi:MAG: phospholipase D family protein [Deltaproteobacteria bacterium]|nr:phospholipase D family protein [Deltaproteobacteria bacterium]